MKKPWPIALQLYSVREDAARDFVAVLDRISRIGYAGVEPAGLHGMAPRELRARLDDLGLQVSSLHGAMPDEENLDDIVETAKTLGYTRHVSGFGSESFADRASILAAAETAQKAAELLAPAGLTLNIHNHWWEFEASADGMSGHRLFMEAAPDVYAQIDTYWVKVGGGDPAAVVAAYGHRAPLLHIKDGPGNREAAMTAVGQGTVDWPTVLGSATDATEWLIVELDRCDGDMMQAVTDSYSYLVQSGFGRGRA